MLKCENCCYYAVSDNRDWHGKEHCCFTEWGHGDWETAPCDEEEYDDVEEEYEEVSYEDYMEWARAGVGIDNDAPWIR